MNNAKVTVPREIADAIESFRKDDYDNAYIAKTALRGAEFSGIWSPRAVVVRSFPFDTLMAALINGYTVEKSAEEIAEDERKATYERIYRRYAFNSNTRYGSGICFALNELGIKIPGVNAPETEVSV